MIKVVFLLAYDFRYVKVSLPLVYEHADKILFSVDKNRVSWSGNTFDFDESILDWIREYDTRNKIEIYEDDFYVKSNTSMQNDTRQRQMSADFLGKGGWTLMIDVDEYFINFKGFVDLLEKHAKYLEKPETQPIAIAANWLNLFKQDEAGFYAIAGSNFPIRIATNCPEYFMARTLEQRTVYTDFVVVHQSWARPREEMKFKMENWSHNSDVIDAENYYEFWDGVNEDNYKSIRNFCNTNPASDWKKLILIRMKGIHELIAYVQEGGFVISKLFVLRKNIIQKLILIPFLRNIHNRYVQYKLKSKFTSSYEKKR